MLLKRLKTLSKESLIYGLAGGLSGVVSFLLLPLYTHALSPEEYGYLSVLTVLQTVIEICTVFGLGSALFRYYLMGETESEKKIVLNTCIWTQVLFIFLLGISFLLLSSTISSFLFGSPLLKENVCIVILTALLSSIHTMVQSVIRAERKPFLFLIIQILRLLLSIALTIYFVVHLKKSYQGVLLANLIATGLSALPFIVWTAIKTGLSFSIPYLKRILRFSGPIFLANLFFFVLNLSDRFFINHFLTPRDVGIYSFGSKIGSIIMVGIISPFLTAVVPFTLSIAREKDFERTFTKIVKYFLIIVVFLSLTVFTFSKEIITVISTSSYELAGMVVGPILLSYIFYGLYYTLSIVLDIIEKTYINTYAILTAAVIGVILNFILIPLCGIFGAVLASCASNAILVIIIYLYTQKLYRLNYETDSLLKIIGLIILFVILHSLLEYCITHSILSFITKLCLLFLFFISLFWMQVLKEEEKSHILLLFNPSKNKL